MIGCCCLVRITPSVTGRYESDVDMSSLKEQPIGDLLASWLAKTPDDVTR